MLSGKVGETLCRIWREVEESTLSKSRRALFGEDFRETYELLQNRFLFVEGGNDDNLFLEHYVLLGNFMNDPDRFDIFDSLLLRFRPRDCPGGRTTPKNLARRVRLTSDWSSRHDCCVRNWRGSSRNTTNFRPQPARVTIHSPVIFQRKAAPSADAKGEIANLRGSLSR